ncbi:MAG: succinate dehydrogenase [Gammaproteobacteria bacterium]
MPRPHRNHSLWFAFLVHRISGLGLAIFLPVHFLVLGLALEDTETMDKLLRWSDSALVKFAEFGLVFLLSVHLFGGLRLLALEFLPWSNRQKSIAAFALAGSFLLAGLFLLRAL